MANTVEIPGTVEEQINEVKAAELSYRNLHIHAILKDKQSNENIKVPYASILNNYREFLKSIVIELELDEDAENLYEFKPKLLSTHLYGTTEYWADIMKLNNIYSLMDFKPKSVVKVYDPDELKEAISEVINFESGLNN